ncbi:MAG: VOC family protein [Solirubrobacteraceae bacterium]|nr:VOC family protein [Solirubrobacteraceae bacterium]
MATTTVNHAVVWTEIPVTDLDQSMKFYEAVLGAPLTRNDAGPNPMADFAYGDGSVAGHLYPGKPAADGAGPTVHLAVPGTVEEAAARCVDAGGSVIGPVITIPPGRFQYATDLDGNSIGLFEPQD